MLTTKLYLPPARPNVVLRPRLIERLNAGLHRKLTLIAAPAGFGKTTLVSAWVAHFRFPISDFGLDAPEEQSIQNPQSPIQNPRVAWLSLDAGDSDLTRFLAYFVAALQTIAPSIGAGVVSVLQSSQPPPTEAILTALLNDIIAILDPFVLVLDDYHVIDAQPVDHALAFLLEHLPAQMHLVITTREDPQLPLARLRARDQMTELRAADLRFTPAEAAAFLSQVMDLDLAAEDVAALEDRTEGWVAGLQLAALSMRGRDDIGQFVRAFAGDNRYIVDYLVDEVLQRQPEQVRSFLLQTAILDRLSGPLCDAVTDFGVPIHPAGVPDFGGEKQALQNPKSKIQNSQMLLEQLERGNFFVVPLDDTRQWYRYHHLFAEVLAAQLRAEQPDLLATLHRRASAWFEQHGSAADAIRHALAAADFARAADLVERAWPAMSRSRQEAMLLGWLRALPDQLLHYRPVLGVAYAHVLLTSGELAGVEERLLSAERWLDMTADMPARPDTPAAETCPEPGCRMVVVDDEAFRRLPGAIAIARAGQALARGDLAGTVTHARRALELAPQDDHLTRGGAAGFLGLAFWTSGDLEIAHQTYADGMASLQKAGNTADAINGAITLAAIRIAQGHLHEAMRTYEQALQLATAQHPEATRPFVRGAADVHVGMSELHRERDDLPAAMQHLLRSKELGEHTGFPQNRYRWCVAMARIREAQGDLAGALDLLDEAERLYMSDFSPNVRPIPALKARMWVAQGRLVEARDWARAQGLLAQDELSYGREFAHITLARLLMASSKRDRADRSMREAVGLLERLLQAAEAGQRTGSVIEILVLLSLAYQAQGDIPAALVPLSRALTLAEMQGYVRMFVDEGEAMRLMILDVRFWVTQQPGSAQNTKMTMYTDKLLARFGNEPSNVDKSLFDEQFKIQSPKSKIQNLVEPLSVRELAVLRLFTTDLSGPQIAQELVIALSTVRTHTKSIYNKLNVTNRRAAVKRAIELDLL